MKFLPNHPTAIPESMTMKFLSIDSISLVYHSQVQYLCHLPSTVTVNVTAALCPSESSDVYLTKVTPILNNEPGMCVDVRVWIPELSTAVGSIQVTRAVDNPLSVLTVILLGILKMLGFSTSVGKKQYLQKETYL